MRTMMCSIMLSLAACGCAPPLASSRVFAADEEGGTTSVAGATAPHGHGGEESLEQAMVLDPETLEIRARIDLGSGLHVAHVVFDLRSRFADVTANEASSATAHTAWWSHSIREHEPS